MNKNFSKLFIVFFLMLLLQSGCSEENLPPTLVILATPASGNAPLSVQCLAEASDPDNNLLTFEWNFGDGSAKSSEQSPAHTFIDAGSFTATCTVTDNGSPRMSTSRTATITVSAPSPILSSLKPAWKVSHLPEFTLTVTGNNFVPSSKIVFNGVEKTVEFVSASEIRCRITPEDTDVFPANTLSSTENSIKAISESTLGVWVRSPSPGGDSQPLNFTIRSNHTFLSPELICSDNSDDYKLLYKRYLYLIYKDSGSKALRIKISKDKGKTWLPSIEIPYSMDSSDLSVTVDETGILYYANFHNYTDIMLTKSSDEGATWTENKLISTGTHENGLCNYSAQNLNITALENDSLHIFWMEQGIECGTDHNYYISSMNHGETWSDRRQEPYVGSENTYNPTLLANGKNTLHYVSYIGETIEPPEVPYYQLSNDSGDTWSSPVLINAGNSYQQRIPSVGLNGYLFLPYLTSFRMTISLAALLSMDQGQSWININSFYYAGIAQGGYVSFISDTAGNVNVLWPEQYNADWTLYFSRMTSLDDANYVWDPAPGNAISPEGYKNFRDSCVVDEEGNIYVICQSRPRPNELYLVRSNRCE